METHAQISAELAEAEASERDVLARHGLTSDEWTKATQHWMTALAEDVQSHGADARLPLLYSDYFATHQQNLKAPLALSPEQWEELQFDIERSESEEEALARRQMSMADYMRLLRIYAKRIAEEPEIAFRVEQRRAQLESEEP
jgi:hypothetical protein